MAVIPPRRERESQASYAKFREYVLLGSQRTCGMLSARINAPLPGLQKLCDVWEWRKRAAEYDSQVWKEDQEAIDLFREQARREDQQFEIERRAGMREEYRAAHRRVLEALNSPARLFKFEQKNGEQVCTFANSFPLMHIALLMREANRTGVAGVTDHHAESEARIKGNRVLSEEKVAAAQIIAGTFSVGETMYDGSNPPPLPEGAKLIPPPPPITEPPIIDLTGTPYEGMEPKEE